MSLSGELLGKDPSSWDIVKELELFINRIESFEIEYTPDARQVTYLAHDNEAEPSIHWWQSKRRITFPNRVSFAILSYKQLKQAGTSPARLFEKASEALLYVHQAYAQGLVRPGPAPVDKIKQLESDKQKLQQQVDELTKKIGEKDQIIKFLGGRPEGELNNP